MKKKIKPVIVPAAKHRNLVTLEHLKNTPKAGVHKNRKKEAQKLSSRKFKLDD